jgi:two-component system, LytTR family, sensor histidine kinase AgrC
MSSCRIFALTFLEVANFMLLWNLFNRRQINRIPKSVGIVFFTSIVVVLTNYIYPTIEFLINYIFLFMMIKFIFKKNIKHLLLEFALLLAIFGILQLVVIAVLRLFSATFMMEDIFLNNLAANLMCLFLSFCAYKFVRYEKLLILYKQESSKIYFFSVNLLIYIVTAKLVWNFERQMFLQEIVMYLIIPVIFILGNMVFLVHHTRNNELRKSLEDYKKYSPVISELLEDVRRRQHDFKNHLNTIYGLIMISDEKTLRETIREYVNSLSVSLENMEKILQINNTVVTAIIYNKINEAAKSGIKFRYTIQGEAMKLPFKDHELSEVLNNLLDNAFDAVLNSENNFKKVFLNIGYLEEDCIIEIGNTGDRIEFKDIGRIFDRGYTTKRGEGRGYGLYNVRKIVEAYGGRIQLSFENSYTIFRIKLS